MDKTLIQIIEFGIALNIVSSMIIYLHTIIDAVTRGADTRYWLIELERLDIRKKNYWYRLTIFIPLFTTYKIFSFYMKWVYYSNLLLTKMIYKSNEYKLKNS